MLTPEQIMEELTSSPEYEEIQSLDGNYALLRKTVKTLLSMEESGEAAEEDVDATIGQALEDHVQNQLDILDLDVEIDDLVESTPEIELGAAIAQILSAMYDDPDEGIADMAQSLGTEPENIIACISGQMVPTMEKCQAIADMYLADQPEAYQEFMGLCDAVHSAEMMADDADMADYGGMKRYQAQMSAEVDGLRAEFAQAKAEVLEKDQISLLLRQLRAQGQQMLQENILTAAEFNSLLGTEAFQQDPDNVAMFSNFCTALDTTPRDYLNAVEFCLNWKQQCGGHGYGAFFSQSVSEPVDSRPMDEDAINFAKEYRDRNGYQ